MTPQEQTTIVEGNKLIQDFLGLRVYKDLWEEVNKNYHIKHPFVIASGDIKTRLYKPEGFTETETACFRMCDNKGLKINTDSFYEAEYHTSLDWLMPVIKKIELLQNEESAFVVSMPLYTPIETVWKAVIEFIKWYNDQFTKKEIPL